MDVETLIRLGTHADSPIEGAHVTNGSNGLKLGETNAFVAEENFGTGITNGGATKLNGHYNLETGVTGNGLNSQLSFENRSGNGSTRSENEIKEYEQLKPEESNKLLVEYDLERVLDEQEIYELVCPNCNECITKRVILRKRKMPQKENPREPNKDEDKKAFRCLSCFSIFIPTECGCNIFRIIWNGVGGNNLGSPEGKPAENGVPSLFGSGSSNLEGVSSPAATDTVPITEEHIVSNEYPPLTTISGTSDLGGKGATCGLNTAGSSAGGSDSNGEIGGTQAQGDEHSYPISTVPEGNDTTPVEIGRLHGLPIDSSANNTRPTASYYLPEGISINIPVSTNKPTSPSTAESNQNVGDPDTHGDTHIDVGVHERDGSTSDNDWDVLKSIVYGGLIESITSLGVVSSAAGSGSTTLNICALGIANLIGGLFVISHDISELRSAHDAEARNQRKELAGRYLRSAHDAEARNQRKELAGRYWEKLGTREHFPRHVIFAVLSYIVFGLLPPVIYGFTFRESDNKEYKIIAAAASSLLCVALLAIGKAHVQQKDYIKSLFYYLGLALPASGLSYVAGIMVNRLFVELGLFDTTSASPSPPSAGDLFRFGSGGSSWASL